jgi:hypothetical protein
MAITGTLKYGSTPSKYLLHGGTVFQWTRGAAASGWLLKWPMKSQAFGGRKRRFFVLRDDVLSYRDHRPKDEGEAYSVLPMGSMAITPNTTVEIGRYMLLRSLIVTTPGDRLWIRSRSGDVDEERWVNELTKSVQNQRRSK